MPCRRITKILVSFLEMPFDALPLEPTPGDTAGESRRKPGLKLTFKRSDGDLWSVSSTTQYQPNSPVLQKRKRFDIGQFARERAKEKSLVQFDKEIEKKRNILEVYERRVASLKEEDQNLTSQVI